MNIGNEDANFGPVHVEIFPLELSSNAGRNLDSDVNRVLVNVPLLKLTHGTWEHKNVKHGTHDTHGKKKCT